MEPVLKVMFSILVLLLFYVIWTYSKEGDIRTIKATLPEDQIYKLYPTKRKIIERMRDLLLYQNQYVRWHIFALIALCWGTVLTYYFTGSFELSTILIVSVLIFTAIDLPNRWANTHIRAGVAHEATMLYTAFNKPSLSRTRRPASSKPSSVDKSKDDSNDCEKKNN